MQGEQSNNNPSTTVGNAYTAAAAASPQRQSTGTSTTSGASPSPANVRQAFRRNLAPVSRDQSSEIVNHFVKAIKEYVDANDDFKKLDIKLVPINRESGIAASAVVVVVPSQLDNEVVLAYHTLMLADDSAKLSENFEQADNTSYLVPKAYSDILDETFISNVAAHVTRAFPQAKMFYADAEVVPVGFNYKDERLLRELLVNTIEATYGEVAGRGAAFQYLNLKDAANANGLSVRTHYHQNEIIDSVGLPVRADIQIDFRLEPANSGNKGTENVEQIETYSTVSGYVDVVYDPVNPVVNPWLSQMAPRRAEDGQLFGLQFVFTSIRASELGTDLSATLLAMYTAFPLLAESQPALQAFMPAHMLHSKSNSRSVGGFDPKDVGALNWEYGLTMNGAPLAPLPTDPEKFAPNDFYAWMTVTTRKGISFAIDVPEAGDSTYFLRAFTDCGVIDSPAHKAIVAAADALTDNKFSPIFNATSRKIITGHENRIFKGTFTDTAGIKHDLRIVDLLYMLNKDGHNNPNIGRQFSNTFNNNIPSVNINLAKRLQMISGAVSDVQITGFDRRETLHGDFIASLDKAVGQTGLSIRQTFDAGTTRVEQRAVGNLYGSGATVTGLNSTTFTTGGYQQQGSGGYRTMYSGDRNYR